MLLIDMRYLWSPHNGYLYGFETDTEFDRYKALNPDYEEVSQDEAYGRLFYRISESMNKKFKNYKYIDIGNNALLMMFERYNKKGTFAPEKPFEDNAKMWWTFASQSCLYIIRQYKLHTVDTPSDLMSINPIPTEIYSEDEHRSTCKSILDYIKKLSVSDIKSEQQMGIYALCKLKGLNDKQIASILEIGVPRLREVKHKLKLYLKLEFGEDI